MSKQDNNFKGFWINRDDFLDVDLSVMEKMMLSGIRQLNNTSKGCYASNNYLADFFNITPSRCSQLISSLNKKGYLNVKIIMDGKITKGRTITIVNKLNRVFRKLTGGIKYSKQGYLIYCEPNSIVINNKEEQYSKSKPKAEMYRSINIEKIPEHITVETAKELIDHRINKKAPFTQNGFNRAMSQAVKTSEKIFNQCGLSPDEVISESIDAGWQGVGKPDWLINRLGANNGNNHNKKPETPFERNERLAKELKAQAAPMDLDNNVVEIPKQRLERQER